jgi:uncharacterized damage-inducible protein DinB
MDESWMIEFIEQSLHRMHENTARIGKCLDQLTEKEVWLRPNLSSNSVGNLMLHLCGNIRQYAVSSLGNLPDTRTRDAEFQATEGFDKKQLLQLLTDTIKVAEVIIQTSDVENILQKRTVQCYNLSGMGIIIHVLEHYSYHTGQIAFWTKELRNKDLGFYAGKELG